MSFSAGVFSINSAGQPVVTGTVISSTAFNALTADLATGLSTAVLKDGTQTLTANIPMANFKLTGLAAGSTNGDSLRYEQLIGTYLALAGGTMTGALIVPDGDLSIVNSADATKKIAFALSGITTGTTRTLTIADLSIALGKQPTRQVFTSGSAATYTTPTGATRINIRLVGGGAGGGGATANNGTAGNNTTFGTLTGNGGSSGIGNGGAGGAGGAASGGDINIPGGGGGGAAGATANNIAGGIGGSSAFGGGGPGIPDNTGGTASANSGGGGTGGGNNNGNTGGGGGAGGYVEKLIIAPSATYTYTVGAAANGGSAGTFAGGNGAAGIIIVDEYYN